MKKLLIKILILIRYDKILNSLIALYEDVKIVRYEQLSKQSIKFVSQGTGGLTLAGDLSKFSIDSTSHLKSGTFIECSGKVEIGRYFHTGRGLTIFSTNHNYENAKKIPYDEKSINKPVIIKDFVWFGSNVTVVPGVTVGEGVVAGAGSVITKDIEDYAIVGGNPAIVIKYRDKNRFNKLKLDKMFH